MLLLGVVALIGSAKLIYPLLLKSVDRSFIHIVLVIAGNRFIRKRHLIGLHLSVRITLRVKPIILVETRSRQMRRMTVTWFLTEACTVYCQAVFDIGAREFYKSLDSVEVQHLVS